jgi:hypothetical protein
MKEMVLSEDFEGRLASLHLSMMRVTKATTFRARTSSTSHITIVGLNIVDPFRPSIAFLSRYLRHRCSIPHPEECRRLKRKDKPNASLVDRLFAARRIVLGLEPGNEGCQNLWGLLTRKNRLASGAAQGPHDLRQKRRRTPFSPFANQSIESSAGHLCAGDCPVPVCAK